MGSMRSPGVMRLRRGCALCAGRSNDRVISRPLWTSACHDRAGVPQYRLMYWLASGRSEGSGVVWAKGITVVVLRLSAEVAAPAAVRAVVRDALSAWLREPAGHSGSLS